MGLRRVDVYVFLIAAIAFSLTFTMMSCAPQGYISGQSACELENTRLKEENLSLRLDAVSVIVNEAGDE